VAKRRLTKQQRERIRHIQSKRQARVAERESQQGVAIDGATLGEEQSGLIIAHYGESIAIESSDGSVQRCAMRQNMEPLVVGDRVVWQANEQGNGVVSALLPRSSLLSRPGFDGKPKPIAANIELVVVVIATIPEPSEVMIDRYLVAAEVNGTHPVILVNKTDLVSEEELKQLTERLSIYSEIGYELHYASTQLDHGLDELIVQLEGRISVLVGQSGVGKSSLVKALMPDLEIRIGAISEQSGLGRHTTTTSVLYHLPQGGDLIDSPGVREFGLSETDPARIIRGFPEFDPYLGLCKFNNCRHTVEPGCALKEAVENGDIRKERLDSFHNLCAGDQD